MGPNPQLPADLVTFTEEILNGKLHFLCSVIAKLAAYELSVNKSSLKLIQNFLSKKETDGRNRFFFE